MRTGSNVSFLFFGEPDRLSHRTQIRLSDPVLKGPCMIYLVPLVLLLTWDCYSSPLAIYFSPMVLLFLCDEVT
jgi:hypothetical protein